MAMSYCMLCQSEFPIGHPHSCRGSALAGQVVGRSAAHNVTTFRVSVEDGGEFFVVRGYGPSASFVRPRVVDAFASGVGDDIATVRRVAALRWPRAQEVR